MATYAIDILSGKLNVYPDGSLNNSLVESGAPGAGDNTYTEGQIWVDEDTDTPYILVDVTAGVATWQQIGSSGTVPDATEVVKGIARLATQAETNAGIIDTAIVTPYKLQNKEGLIILSTREFSANNSANLRDQIVVNTAGNIEVDIPATAAQGEFIYFMNIGTGTFDVIQNAGQTIRLGNQVTTTGVTGKLSATAQGDSFKLVCVTANTDWQVVEAVGNLELT